MGRKRALKELEKGKIVTFKDQGLSARAIAKKLKKISWCNIEFSLITRGVWSQEISRTSSKAVRKAQKSHYKKNEQ